MQNLLEKSQPAQQLSLEIASDFITDCLAAIRITCNVIADHLEADENIFARPYQQLSFKDLSDRILYYKSAANIQL
uniref:Uncharacterized protein n=1 Tax=Glossina palpalis gambiensis TaxID=67801 RepID=A0A1B0C6K4_9MUSC